MDITQKNIQLQENEVQAIRNMFEQMYNEQRSKNPHKHYYTLKRFFDIIGASILFLITFWIFPIIAMLVKISSRGPIIYSQKRTGLHEQEFACHKFRTMYVNAEADTKQASDGDTRITKLGNFLRKTHLDELPQLFNIFKGEMSLVGPRPHMIYHTKQFTALIPFYNLRHQTRPGLTGLAQIKGYIGEIQEERDIIKRVQWDIFYLNHQSAGMDINILLNTAEQVFRRFF